MVIACLVSPALARDDPPDAGEQKQLQPGDRKPTQAGGDSSRATLSAAEIERYIAPYYSAIRECFVSATARKRSATGALKLELIIHRDGTAFHLAIAAPGVTGAARKKLETCIRKETERWHFPVRFGFTSAVVPYYFLRTPAPAAGPKPSCWSPRGCPSRDTAKPSEQR